jgi:class 3 adenylate cyclase/alpha-beta hydrolase superfamily lysophospholipase
VCVSEVEYARVAEDTQVAFRVLVAEAKSDRPVDMVMVSGGLIPMELFTEQPGFVRLLEGLCSLGRVVVFDRRGIGLSDPIVDWSSPVLDQWADDLAAVVEASGVRDPVVFAWDGYGVATRFAARQPDRLSRLILHQPVTVADDQWESWAAERRGFVQKNVDGVEDSFLARIAPSRGSDASFQDWYSRAGRAGASPTSATRIWNSVFSSTPADQLLGRVETPTLVLHRRDNVYSPSDGARLAASQLSRATIVELDGSDHFPFLGDVDSLLAEIADFVVGERRLPPPERIVAAVMYTDLVGSTQHAASLGDERWKSLLDRHDATLRATVERSGGVVVKTTGDGILATLPSAGAALRAAERVRDALAVDGLGVRIGIHLGDIDRRGDDVSGLGVVVAARAMALGDAGQIVVTASIPPAVIGQAVTFEPFGTHELKGIPGAWPLHLLVSA